MVIMSRNRPRSGRRYLISLTLALVVGACGGGVAAQPSAMTGSPAGEFSRQWLVEQARIRSTEPFSVPELAPGNPLRELGYDDYRRIFFNTDAAIWRSAGHRFQLQLFHPGFIYTQPVAIHLVDNASMRPLPFDTDLFNYHSSLASLKQDFEQVADVGYAGFRVHHPINTADYYDEFLVFLGASYFRAVGAEQFYGLSARGLGVNTVGPGDEEFPRFSDFWIEQPATESELITVHALLDSRSVTGAFHFQVSPGAPTLIDVEATLFPRVDLPRVGIAPLTSMFLFDATNRDRFDDYRNAVHDSDGLQILQANGETVWRPLTNPSDVQVSAFQASDPVGFGLLQRHQQFAYFNDDEARYDKRTSLWIEPVGDWGEGHIELLEIPTGVETSDNIVAYWQPSAGLEAGKAHRFNYRMYWGEESPISADAGRVVNTAAGAEHGSERLFVIDYSGGDQIPDVTSDPDAVLIHATTSAGVITSTSGTLVANTGNYRAYVRMDPAGTELAELHITLEVDGERWGETWLYRWTP